MRKQNFEHTLANYFYPSEGGAVVSSYLRLLLFMHLAFAQAVEARTIDERGVVTSAGEVSPFDGRWLSRDPSGESGGLNLHGYCHNDPINGWDYLGLWDGEGTLAAYQQIYGADAQAMSTLSLVMSHYQLSSADYWLDDWGVDHENQKIFISDDGWLPGRSRSNENAAKQLYQDISDDAFLGRSTGLPETWGGAGRRIGGGVVEVAGGVASVMGGSALMVAPEPALTKVGGYAAVTLGGNSIVAGGSWIFGGRGGGIDPLNELAGAYGHAVGGSDGEAQARFFMGAAEITGQLPGGVKGGDLGRNGLKGGGSFAAKTTATGAESTLQGVQLNRHLTQLEKYGAAGSRILENGRVRYYGNVDPARTPGEMAGRRLVREWDPSSNATRTWHETVDHAGSVRQVRPETGGPKVRYRFDANGNYTGSWWS